MADNVIIPASGTGDATPKVATEQVAATLEHKQIVELGVPGTGRTLVPADSTYGLSVDITRTVASKGQVNETPEAYITGEVQPLSMTTEGRLRVSAYPATTYMELFHGGNFMTTIMDMTDQSNPWGMSNHPWSL